MVENFNLLVYNNNSCTRWGASGALNSQSATVRPNGQLRSKLGCVEWIYNMLKSRSYTILPYESCQGRKPAALRRKHYVL